MFVYVCNCWLEHCVNRWRCERLIRQFQHLNTLNIELIWGYVQIFILFFLFHYHILIKEYVLFCPDDIMEFMYSNLWTMIQFERKNIPLIFLSFASCQSLQEIEFQVNERNAFILLMEGIISTFTWFVTTRDYSDNISNGYDWQIMITMLMEWGFILNIELWNEWKREIQWSQLQKEIIGKHRTCSIQFTSVPEINAVS